MRSLTFVGVVLAIVALPLMAGCGGGKSPVSGGVQVTGNESIGWDQSAPSLSDLQSLSYYVFVDGVKGDLAGVSCGTSAGINGFSCSAPLPPLTKGQHTLQLAAARTVNGVLEQSTLSPPLTVLNVGSSNSNGGGGLDVVTPGDRRTGPESDPRSTGAGEDRFGDERAVVITDKLVSPTALAPTPDGRVFVAQRDRVLLIESGAVRPEPALVLNTPGAAGEAGFPDITLDPSFSSNHLVWSSQIVQDGARRVVRITRYTEAFGNLGASAVIAELPVGAMAGRTRVRVGPDDKLYVTTADLSDDVDRDSVYEGSIVRLEKDGSTPRDNHAHGPVLSAGHGNVRAIAWPSGSTELWDVEARDGVSTIQPLALITPPLQAERAAANSSRRFAVAGAPDLTGLEFLPGSPALIAVAASPLAESVFRLVWTGDRLAAPVPLLTGRFGAIREVGVAPDGTIYVASANNARRGSRGGDFLIRVPAR